MDRIFDVAVIGAGIAGASVAARLSKEFSVLLLEAEERPGYHATGRSAAAYEPNYGPAVIRALTRASWPFFASPPEGFADAPLMTPRETVFVSRDQAAFERLLADSQGLEEISLAQARAKHPLLRASYDGRAVLDPGTADLDVDLLHRGFLKMAKANGAVLACNARTSRLARGSAWTIKTPAGVHHAKIVINAAGAWADMVAIQAGAKPRGIQPKRRSMAVIPVPAGLDATHWPLIGDVEETWYCKPQSGKLLVSPADAIPVEAHDAFADDEMLAIGIDRMQQVLDIEVTRVEHSWGGLRSFAPDGNPACGFDPDVEGFFWLAGQGGYGIQTAPALSLLAAEAIAGREAAVLRAARLHA
jgi:D-arginine dehydrogenase